MDLSLNNQQKLKRDKTQRNKQIEYVCEEERARERERERE